MDNSRGREAISRCSGSSVGVHVIDMGGGGGYILLAIGTVKGEMLLRGWITVGAGGDQSLKWLVCRGTGY